MHAPGALPPNPVLGAAKPLAAKRLPVNPVFGAAPTATQIAPALAHPNLLTQYATHIATAAHLDPAFVKQLQVHQATDPTFQRRLNAEITRISQQIEAKRNGGVAGIIGNTVEKTANPLEWAKTAVHGVGELHRGHVGAGVLDLAAVLPVSRGPRAVLEGAKAYRAAEEGARAADAASAARTSYKAGKGIVGGVSAGVRKAATNLKVTKTLERVAESPEHGRALRLLHKEVRGYGRLLDNGAGEETLTAAKNKIAGLKSNELYTRLHAISEAKPLKVGDVHFEERQQLAQRLLHNARGGTATTALPPGARTLPKLHHLISFLDELTTKGEHGRLWYETSSHEILKMAGGDAHKADKFAQLLAIYSPQQPILGNTSFAVRAWNQFHSAMHEFETGRQVTTGQKWQQDAAERVLSGAGDWEGRKTNNFYVNFAEDIWHGHPDAAAKLAPLEQKIGGPVDRAVTSDLWMARAFGFPMDEVSKGRYDVIEKVVQQIADERGWKPKQVQAAIWTAIKDASDDVSANIAFDEGIARHAGQINYEAAVSSPEHGAIYSAYRSWDPQVQQAFLRSKMELVDAFLRDAGYLHGQGFEGPGVYAGEKGIEFNPGAANEVLTSAAPRDTGGYDLLPVERARMDAAAAAIGRALKQDSVAWVRPFLPRTKGRVDSYIVRLGRTATPEEAQALWHSLNPGDVERLGVVHTKDGLMVRNFGGYDGPVFATKGESFESITVGAVDSVFTHDTQVIGYATDGRLVENTDYEGIINGAGQTGNGAGSSGGLRLREAADRLAGEADALDRQFLERGAEPGFAAGFRRVGQRLADERGELNLGGFSRRVKSDDEATHAVEQAIQAARAEGYGAGVATHDISKVARGEAPEHAGGALGQQVREGLTGAADQRLEQEALRHPERAARARAAHDAMQIGGEQGYHAALGELKGELPKLNFHGFDSFDQQTLDAMLTHIQQHPDLRPYEKVRAQGAIVKATHGGVPTKSEQKLLERVFGREVAGQIKDSIPFWHKVRHLGLEVLNVPRALQASYDLSAPFRQGLVVGVSYPRTFFMNFRHMVKAFGSERVYQGLMSDIHERPTFALMQKAKLALTDIGVDPHGTALELREEQFMSNLAERIPIIGHGIRASDRAYTGFLNKTRADVFDMLIHSAATQGLDVNDTKLLESIARFVNSATGRGDLGALQKHAVTLNTLLFSPRLLASRLNFLNPVYYAKLEPFARREALKSARNLVAAMGLVLYLAKLGGAQVNLDPRNADFAKIKIGDTRIDIAGGFQQPVRLLSQLFSGKVISSTTGKTMVLGPQGPGKLSRRDILQRFFESKLAPVPSFANDYLRGTDFAGNKFSWRSAAVSRMTPLLAQDAASLYHDAGPEAAAGGFLLGSLGIGIQSYKAKPTKEKTPKDFWSNGSTPSDDSSGFWSK